MLDLLVTLVLAGMVVAAALAAAAVLAASRLVSFALAAWIVAFGETVALGLGLSTLHAADLAGYAVAETAVVALAAAAWLRAGRPIPPLPTVVGWRSHPVLVVLGAAVAASLTYELLLAVTVSPNNWDSLTYRLARVADWHQNDAVRWIDDAQTERQNAFPANAELAVLWTFVAAGSDRLAALPQLLAQAAALVATYGLALRLGLRRTHATFAALLLATLSLVALQSTTTQNDLVVASLVGASAYFVTGTSGRDGCLAGVALALAIGTKLTAALAVPGLLLLAVAARPARRVVAAAALGAVLSFLLLDAWLYVRNWAETGRVLGVGHGRVEHQADPTPVGWLATVIRVLYRFLDFSGFEGSAADVWVAIGVLCAAAAATVVIVSIDRRGDAGRQQRWELAAAALVPLLVPVAVGLAAVSVRAVLKGVDFPIDPRGTSSGPFAWRPFSHANEDFSYFGPVGAVVAALALTVLGRSVARRRLTPIGALAASFALFVAGLALVYRFNSFLGRFMVVPVVMAAPLLGTLYGRRIWAAGLACLATAVLALTHLNNVLKPALEAPWSMSRAETVGLQTWQEPIASGIRALERTVPEAACVGAALGGDDAAYPLFGPHLERRIVYLDADPLLDARRKGVEAIVFGPGRTHPGFGRAWRLTSLGGYWRLAVRTGRATTFTCRPTRAQQARGQYAPRRVSTAGIVFTRIPMSSQIDQFSR